MNRALILSGWMLALGTGSAFVSAQPVRMEIERAAGSVRLSWTSTGLLERSTSPGGPWTIVEGATSPHAVSAVAGVQFYRLRQTHRVTVERFGDGQGTVSVVPPGIDCGTDCAEEVSSGSRITLTATPAAGSEFAGWTGDCTGTGPCELTVDAPRTVRANFTAATTPTNSVVNGNFEAGPEIGWLQAPGNMIYTAAELQVTPYSGNYAAWLGTHPDGRRSAAMGQRVTLPAAPPIFLNLALWLYSEELCDVPWYDAFGIFVEGEALAENSRLCRGNTGGDGWRRLSFDISRFAGRTVLIGFEISSSDVLSSVALIDDVAVAGAPW